MKINFCTATVISILLGLGISIPAKAEFLGKSSCKGVILPSNTNDFYSAYKYPNYSSPAKPGVFLYSGEAVNIVDEKDGFYAIPIELQQNTLAWTPASNVVKVCGANVPQPERWVFPYIDY